MLVNFSSATFQLTSLPMGPNGKGKPRFPTRSGGKRRPSPAGYAQNHYRPDPDISKNIESAFSGDPLTPIPSDGSQNFSNHLR